MEKKTAILTIILLIAAGLGGCKQSSGNQNEGVITVDVTKSYPKKELILQEFMDVEYIALETTDDFLCQGEVQAIGKEFIVVKNRINDGDIFIFDRNGKGMRKINRKGQSGEEYSNISGITLDEDNGEMFVIEASTNRIMAYDLYGRFKRSLQYKEGSNYRDVFNFDMERLICRENSFSFELGTVEMPPFVIISKQDGNIVSDIQIPFEQKKSTSTLIVNGQSVTVMPTNPASISSISILTIRHFPIIPYHDGWILIEPSSDTVYRFSPDYSLIPFMVRTPSIQSMNPEVFLFPRILSDRYYLMETVKKEPERPKTDLVYDKQEKTIYEYTLYNGDYSNKRTVDMIQKNINDGIVFWQKIESYELVESYEKGELKGKLKEIAAKLDAEDNPVIMLVKNKK
jgi:hypothetical protein